MSVFTRILSALALTFFATSTLAAINPASSLEDEGVATKIEEQLTGLGQLDLQRLIDTDTVEDIFQTPAGGEKIQTAALWTCRAHTYCRNGRRISCWSQGYSCYSQADEGVQVYCQANGGARWSRATCR
ncbi:MAG: hypothetical protein H6624_12920 [Bdellovibrionaceae bacterium]|nr:hypothetical protein [Bdellovibrionales bacterium]MCB9085245.1 hypothetical protein [Pseudobdellovibrionaceae bacterium]